MLEEEQPSIRTYEGARSAAAPLVVVALGAAAGGLDALRELFDALAGSVGMAFVVIEHIEGGSRSLLPSVLGQLTSIPVQEISEGQVLAPDQIFVAPPNVSVELDRLSFVVRPALGPELR